MHTDVDTRAQGDEPGDAVTRALAQLRLEHGDHPCYDAIEGAVLANAVMVKQLRGALKAVAVIATDAFGS